jgi:hypothetical protein
LVQILRKFFAQLPKSEALPPEGGETAAAADDDVSGTYKLVIEQRKIVETGEIA